jgi:hypothetical protein
MKVIGMREISRNAKSDWRLRSHSRKLLAVYRE